MAEHGRDAVAVYIGNPTAHNLAALLYGRLLLKALGTKNLFSASTVDQQPKQLAVGHLFGTGLSVPLPDLDRTDHLLVLGANPMASNGSLMTAPDVRGRLRAIRARGGRIVVVDPRRTRTAQEADEHVAIRPGTDAFLLLAMVHVLVTEDLVDLGDAAPHVTGVEEVRELALGCTPEDAAERCGIEADTVRRLARDLAAADRRRRLRPDRHDDAALRHRRQLARRRPQHAHGQPRPPRWRDVRDARRGRRRTRRARPGAAGARGPRGTRAACAASPRSSASCPWPRWPRRSRRPAPARCARC